MSRFPLPFWSLHRRSKATRRDRVRRGIVIEHLEDRCVPVVGFDSIAAEVSRGGSLDGVLLVEQGDNYGTGSLLYSGRHVLTAAHVVDGAEGKTLTFQLNRGSLEIDIAINVPAAYFPAAWKPGGAANQGNDLALLTLIDQVVQEADRHLVAPFGAQSYSLYEGMLQGAAFTMVGYGRTGTGVDGNHIDEVQRIRLIEPSDGGTFTLTFDGETTEALPHNASSADVQAALVALASIGVGNVEVSNRGLPAGTWDVRFVRQLGNKDVDALTGSATNGARVEISETFAGGQSEMARIKRQGQNVIDEIDGEFLRFDFDNGTEAQNSMGGLGLGRLHETALERGDSGSPLLIDWMGGYYLAGVFSYFATGGAHDFNHYSTPDGSFGTTGSYINLADHTNDFLLPGLRGDYHLVLDMQQQVLGLDGIEENLTIRAAREGNNLVLSVFGSSDPRFNGVYYRAPLTSPDGRILSLTLRGSDDNENFLIDGDLGLESVTIDGRGGANTLQLSTTSDTQWRITGPNQGSASTNQIAFENVQHLQGGIGNDHFRFAPGGSLSGDLLGGQGNDTIDYAEFDQAIATRLQGGSFVANPDYLGAYFGPWSFVSGFQGVSTAIDGMFRSIEGVIGSPLFDTLFGDDSSNIWHVTAQNAGSVDAFSFESIENLIGGQWTDRFVFQAGAGISGRLDAGMGIDELDYSAYDSAVTVNLQLARATAVGQSFASIEWLIGSNSTDELIGPDVANTWRIHGPNQGTLNGQLSFLSIERVTGGSRRDVFAFLQMGMLSDRVDGGLGSNWLDYRVVTESVTVELNQSRASRVGEVARVQNVLGSSGGNDNLIGDAGRNILVGFGSGNSLRGAAARDLLISGLGQGFVAGGAGDDIAIAGSSAYDTDLNALEAFMAEWGRALAYNTRVTNLLQGRGLTGGRRLLAGAKLYANNGLVQVNRAVQGKQPSRVTTPLSSIYGNVGLDFFAVRNRSLVADLDRRRERVV